MKISDETKDLIEKINDDPGKIIKNNFEVSVIIESALRSDDKNIFNDLIFKAKYINGLKNVLANRIITGDDFMEKIFKEFNKTFQAFSELLKRIAASNDDNTVKYFNDKYFNMDQESMIKSMELVEDLAVCKEFFNKNPDYILR